MSKIKLEKLHIHPDNPKSITDVELERLKQSIVGFERMLEIRPIIYDENFFILAGNQRMKALLELGYTEIPKKWTKQVKDLTADQKKQFIVRDNVENGHWVMEAFETEFWEDTPFQMWLGPEEEVKIPEIKIGNFSDDGIQPLTQYGVIVYCDDAKKQEEVFNKLKAQGLKCKIVVT